MLVSRGLPVHLSTKLSAFLAAVFAVLALSNAVEAQTASGESSPRPPRSIAGPVTLTAVSGGVALVGLLGFALGLNSCVTGDDDGADCRRGLAVLPTISALGLAGVAGGAIWTKRRLAQGQGAMRLDTPAVRLAGPITLTVAGTGVSLIGLAVTGAGFAACTGGHGSEGCFVVAAAGVSTLALGVGALAGGAVLIRRRRHAAAVLSVVPWITPQAAGRSVFGLAGAGTF